MRGIFLQFHHVEYNNKRKILKQNIECHIIFVYYGIICFMICFSSPLGKMTQAFDIRRAWNVPEHKYLARCQRSEGITYKKGEKRSSYIHRSLDTFWITITFAEHKNNAPFKYFHSSPAFCSLCGSCASAAPSILFTTVVRVTDADLKHSISRPDVLQTKLRREPKFQEWTEISKIDPETVSECPAVAK